MSQFQYLVILTKQTDGGYMVSVPALPGCLTEGNTKKQALKNIRDAICGYLLVAKKHHLPLFSGVQELETVEVVSGVIDHAQTSGC